MEIYLKIKIRNIRQKKYVAVEDPKLHKIDRVNFFLQCVFFQQKKLKTKNFATKLIQFKTNLAENRLLVDEDDEKHGIMIVTKKNDAKFNFLIVQVSEVVYELHINFQKG